MSTPYVGEIRLFAGNFAPNGWLRCDGSLLPIEQYDVLFNLIGTTYGGDGQSNFAVPDLQGRVAMHRGPNNTIGEQAGTEQVTLSSQQLPNHTHTFAASTGPGTLSGPQSAVVASPPGVAMYIRDAPGSQLPANLVTPTGGSQPHSNLMPTVAMTYIISPYGIYPSPT